MTNLTIDILKSTERSKEVYRIGTFSKLTGASIRTLRYYDEIDLFKLDNIDIYTGYRYYSDAKIEEYKIITELKNVGFTLEEIKNYWNNFDDFKMNEKKQQLLNQINITKEKIKKIDYLRSCIHNGKIILNNPTYEIEHQKVKKIDNNLNTIKRIVKASYDQLLFQRKTNLNQTLANDVKSKKATYYIIYENSSITDDFIIYNSNNLLDINLNNPDSTFNSIELMHLIFDKLKSDYKYITILIKLTDKGKINLAKQYGFIEDNQITKNQIKYIQMKKNLN